MIIVVDKGILFIEECDNTSDLSVYCDNDIVNIDGSVKECCDRAISFADTQEVIDMVLYDYR